MNNQTVSNTERSLLSVRQFSKKHTAFPESSLRWLIFNEVINGFSDVVVRIGRRVFIDEDRFFEWVDDQQSPNRQKP